MGLRLAARIAAATAALALAGVAAAGCATAGITRAGLQADFGPTFANLYVVQQQLLGHPDAVADAQLRTANCAKGGPGTPDRGAGNDWTCQVYWPTGTPGQPTTAAYEVDVKPAGCYTAQGPAAVVGQQTILAADGRTVTNPLYEFYGCLDLG